MSSAIKSTRERYNIVRWSNNYFDINAAGRLVVYPTGRPESGEVDLFELASELHKTRLSLPVLFRFSNILRDRVHRLKDAFQHACARNAYTGAYTPVYPIKVNQQKSVVEEIVKAGAGRVGLEVGSKPELMAVLGLAPQGGIIVCNGYKDREYLRLALIGHQLGHRVYIVLEKLSELNLLLDEAADMGVTPMLGVRVRLASIGAGKWQNSGGEKSKFGFSATQLLSAVERLRQAGRLDVLKLLHCHLGSQVANIRDIQRGVHEAGRCFAELRRLDVPIEVLDVGGGLGVDYEGTRSQSFCSMNYSLSQYAQAIVRTFGEICAEDDLPHPEIISESGRAITAHHAILVTEVIDTDSVPAEEPAPPGADAPLILNDLWQGLQRTCERTAIEAYQDALYWIDEVRQMYAHGVLNLRERAHAEQIYQAICRRLHANLRPESRAHRDIIDDLDEKLADKYFCNMSIFQSLPDIWAIDQVFPIMPLARLDELPTRRAVLQDLTCDSDGRIDHYVDREGLETTLAVHPLKPGEPYLLGIFLVGAYQEILGDMHNLFGDTNSVNVELGPGGVELVRPEHGDSADMLLKYVHFDPDELAQSYRRKIAAAQLNEGVRERYLKELQDGLTGYTYLEE